MTARTGQSPVLPLHVLGEYAVLADGERGAVVGPRGDIVWMCAPRWHSDSVFSALIGGVSGYSVTPVDRFVWGGHYEDGSMIWHGRWTTGNGIAECRDALAFPGDPQRVVLLRRILAISGAALVDVILRPRSGYDQLDMTEVHRDRDMWTARVGDLYLRWSGAADAFVGSDGHELRLRADVDPGDHRDLVLEVADRPLPRETVDPDGAWRATEDAWRDQAPALDRTLSPRAARQSYAVLRGLTSRSGGMVAAATTSLPERAEAGRNYDYRYVWMRDQCYAGRAAAAAGAFSLLDSAVEFVAARLIEHGDQLAPAYTTTGDAVPDQRHLDLPGYPGGNDIVGNWVNQQFQLDAYGEALHLFAIAADLDRLTPEHQKAVQIAAASIDRHWTKPDAGIWEIDNRHWTHSRLTAAGGLRAAAGRRLDPGRTGEWIGLADHIVTETSRTALHQNGHWQRSPHDPTLDAALLLPGLRAGVAVDDPRTRTTLNAYLGDLTRDGYAYRFRHAGRPLGEAEGSFLLCGFLVAQALEQTGDHVEAHAWFERTRAACGAPRLFSEEYDATENQMRGNLPQAFVHALMLETAAQLAH